MIDLNNLGQPKDPEAKIILVMGEPGIGKTTFGANCPSPVILTFEQGLSSLSGREDVRVLECPKHTKEIKPLFAQFLKQDHPHKTLVVDSITAFLSFLEDEIVREDGAKSLAQAHGGFNKGFKFFAAEAKKFAENCVLLRDRGGMNIVWISHTKPKMFYPADGEGYERYDIMGHDSATPPFIMLSDIVGFIRQQYTLKSTADNSRSIVKGTGARELIVHTVPYAPTKNRLGIDKPLKLTSEPPTPLDSYLAH